MKRRILVSCMAVLLVAATALAEDFWASKEYTQWNGEEVRKLIRDSPWAKDVTVTAPAAAVYGAARRPTITDETETGGGGGRGRRGGGGGGGGAASSDVQFTVSLSWRSALPFKQAMARNRLSAGGELPADVQQMLAREDENYVLAVSGIPPTMAPAIQNTDQLKQSVLKAGKQTPIPLAGIDIQQRTQSIEVFFVFPRISRITADDKDVEVVLKLGPAEVKKKFNLKDMVYRGKLEL